MKPKIGIIDYGVGNLFSVQQACNYAGLDTAIVSHPNNLNHFQGLILPGVGSFETAMENLTQRGFIEPFNKFIEGGGYFIGICLGMQLLLTKSLEFGEHSGLNLIKGKVKKFKTIHNRINYSIPQIQWNKIKKRKDNINKPFSYLSNDEYMYFVHSYYCDVNDKDNIITTTEYAGIEYPSIIRQNNVIGIQFHPEKSGKKGLDFYNELNQIMKEK
jgi:glutamine amidotransferase